MNPHLLDPWEPFIVIEWGSDKYPILTRIVYEDAFTNRMKFMLVFPDGTRRMLGVCSSKQATIDYDAMCGPDAHKDVVREMVVAEAINEIKAAAKVHSQPKPDVKLVLTQADKLIYTDIDFAKVEAQMMAQVFHTQPSSSGAVYGPSVIAGSAIKLAKAQKVMGDAIKKLASGFLKSAPIWDSFAGMSKTGIFKTLYGGGPPVKLTPTGLATLKRFGVALAG